MRGRTALKRAAALGGATILAASLLVLGASKR